MQTIIFDPSVDQLQQIVAATSKITADDLSNDAQLALVHDTRISLRDARVKIEKTGKALRADALKYQKDVITREKELLAIITPEEDRLTAIEQEATQIKERSARMALLPMRREQLVGFEEKPSLDGFLLDMNNDEFIVYLMECKGQKLARDMADVAIEKARLADEAHIAQVKKDAELMEHNRLELAQEAAEERRIEAAAQKKLDAERAAQKIIDDAYAESKRIEQEAWDKVAKEVAQKEAAEREAKIRKEQQEADEKYQKWLSHIGWKKDEDHLWLFDRGTFETVRAYKLVDTFKK